MPEHPEQKHEGQTGWMFHRSHGTGNYTDEPPSNKNPPQARASLVGMQ